MSPTVHPGETGEATWRTITIGDLRVRLVKYSAGYLADHWCDLGHVLYVLEGELDTELRDGRTFKLRPGMSYQVSERAMRHIARRRKPAPNSSSSIEIAALKAPLLCLRITNGVMAITVHPDLAAFDRLKTRIQGLRAKTTDNGCTEAEVLSTAAKVAELLDRYLQPGHGSGRSLLRYLKAASQVNHRRWK